MGEQLYCVPTDLPREIIGCPLEGVWAAVGGQKIIGRYQLYVLTVPLLYSVLFPTCFGSNLPSSGSLLGFSELLEIQIEWYIIRGVSKTFGEWYQKTNKTEHTNKLTLLAFKIIATLHNTLLATFIKVLETVSKGLFRNRS
jgi:hypothetical protein